MIYYRCRYIQLSIYILRCYTFFIEAKDVAMMKSDNDYGYFRLELEKYLKDNNISKYQLRKDANLQPTQLLTYCRNEVQRLDLAVMARICHALNCSLSDIVKYVPPEK